MSKFILSPKIFKKYLVTDVGGDMLRLRIRLMRNFLLALNRDDTTAARVFDTEQRFIPIETS